MPKGTLPEAGEVAEVAARGRSQKQGRGSGRTGELRSWSGGFEAWELGNHECRNQQQGVCRGGSQSAAMGSALVAASAGL